MPAKAAGGQDSYRDVRALARGLTLLEALGALGWTRPGALSAYAGIDRSTVYRLLNTLEQLGYLVRREEDGAVALTAKVARLADGVRADETIAQIVAPLLKELTEAILWPSDFARFTGGAVTIQVSTHRISPVSIHRRVVGTRRPLVRSALGRAILAATAAQDRAAMLDIVARLGGEDARDIDDRRGLDRLLEAVGRQGYAASQGETEARIGAIALPVRLGQGVVGAVNVIYFRNAMTSEAAAERYLKPLADCVQRIEAALAAQQPG